MPGGLLNQVQHHPAQVAVDDVRPCAGVVELHGVNDLPGRLCCRFVTRHPLLDRVPVVDEEVLVWDRGLTLRPPSGRGRPATMPWNHRTSHSAECLSRPSSDRAGRRCASRVVGTDPSDLPDQCIPLLVEEADEGIPLVRGGELRRHCCEPYGRSCVDRGTYGPQPHGRPRRGSQMANRLRTTSASIGFRNFANHRLRIRWACTRQHRRASATTSELPGQVR
jgi:hypothetical protein